MVLAGRIMYGLGIGVSMHAGPLYIGETVPSELRGQLISLKEAAIVVGIIAGYAAGATFGADAAWRSVYGVALPIEALMAAGALLAIPESPRWLALRGRSEEAIAALQQAQGMPAEEARDVVGKMARADKGVDGAPLSAVSRLLETAGNRKALTIGIGLVFLQQLSGQVNLSMPL